MFRPMRRNKQALTTEETEAIIYGGQTGVLALYGDGGYPYAVPLNYAYEDGKLYFHWATSGHKLDGILRNDKVSFCVIAQDDVVPEQFATYYRSAIAFGRARLIEDDATKRRALELLVHKYSPGYEQAGAVEIEREWRAVAVVEVVVEHLSGKVAKGLVQRDEASGD